MHLNSKFGFGKHNGQTVDEVLEENPRYIYAFLIPKGITVFGENVWEVLAEHFRDECEDEFDFDEIRAEHAEKTRRKSSGYKSKAKKEPPPPKQGSQSRPFWEFELRSCFDLPTLKEKYRRLCNIMHPDKGGNGHEFSAMNDFYNARLEELNSLPF